MRKITYTQVTEELDNALEAIDRNYTVTFEPDNVQIIPGEFAYIEYTVELPKIVLPCGITIEGIYAIYPDDQYTAYGAPESEFYGIDLISNADVWNIPDDLQVYHSEDDINDPDAEPYTDEELMHELKYFVLAMFLCNPKRGGRKLDIKNVITLSFYEIAEQWLRKADLNQLSEYEDDLLLAVHIRDNTDFMAKYTTELSRLDRLPDCLNLTEMKLRNNSYCNGELDLSHFEDENENK